MIRRISRLGDNARTHSSQILVVDATTEVTAARFRRLDEDHNQTRRIIDFLHKEVTTARVKVRELMV